MLLPWQFIPFSHELINDIIRISHLDFIPSTSMSANLSMKPDSGRTYHTQCTGDALITVKAHERDEDMTLFGGCFCPFVQRVWVVFEVLGLPYKVRNDVYP